MASRYYYYDSSDETYHHWRGRYIDSLEGSNLYELDSSKFYENSNSYAIRPIVTLKSDLVITNGDGSSSSPYQLLNVSQ